MKDFLLGGVYALFICAVAIVPVTILAYGAMYVDHLPYWARGTIGLSFMFILGGIIGLVSKDHP